MNNTEQSYSLLPYGVIAAASHGDPVAMGCVLRHFRGYITKLSARTLYDDFGNTYLAVDPDVYAHLEDALIAGVLNFDLAA